MRLTAFAAITLIAAGLGLGACADREQRMAPRNAPAAGSTSLGPEGTAGMTNSPTAGSDSNAASGSGILRQEGPTSGAPVTQ